MIENLNKAFESRIRLGIMSILMVEDRLDFITAKERLGLTDGNLASHTNSLEKLGYLIIEKEFVGRKTRTSYIATEKGRKAFKQHLDALEQLLNGS
ncbi:transcriptional regulator [bacterium]|nr:transcriptional regulator [bacterium]